MVLQTFGIRLRCGSLRFHPVSLSFLLTISGLVLYLGYNCSLFSESQVSSVELQRLFKKQVHCDVAQAHGYNQDQIKAKRRAQLTEEAILARTEDCDTYFEEYGKILEPLLPIPNAKRINEELLQSQNKAKR